VKTTDFGDLCGIEHGSALPPRRDPSRGLSGHTPHSAAKALASGLFAHRRPPRAARLGPAAGGPAAALRAASQKSPPAWKIDPLRHLLTGDAHGTRADGEHCPHAHEASSDGGFWRPGAAHVEPLHCSIASRSNDRGQNGSRWRTAVDSADSGAHEEREPQTASQPPVPALWTTATHLCEALNVLVAPRPLSSEGGSRNNGKTPAATGVFFFPPASSKHTPPAHPPRYARDDAGLDLMVKISTDSDDRPQRLSR